MNSSLQSTRPHRSCHRKPNQKIRVLCKSAAVRRQQPEAAPAEGTEGTSPGLERRQPRGVSAPPAVPRWGSAGKIRSAPPRCRRGNWPAVPSKPWKNSLQIKENKLQQACEYHKFLWWPAKYRCSICVWDSQGIRPPPCLGSVPGSAECAGMLLFPLRARVQTGGHCCYCLRTLTDSLCSGDTKHQFLSKKNPLSIEVV